MGAGILPIAFHNGEVYLLFGEECNERKWIDFGGGKDKGESTIQTATRECYEELDGFLGSANELKQMIEFIRLAEQSRGYKTGVTESEMESIQGRRSVVLKRDVVAGEKLSVDTLTTKRPYYDGCIKAEKFFELVEKDSCFLLNLEKDEFLKDEYYR